MGEMMDLSKLETALKAWRDDDAQEIKPVAVSSDISLTTTDIHQFKVLKAIKPAALTSRTLRTTMPPL